MKFTQGINGLRIFPEGAISTDNAAAVEADIQQIIARNPGLPVCLDLDSVPYISSSGLRLFLKLRKSLKVPLTLENASREVCHVFSVTGLDTMIDVKEKMRTISVDGCEVIGSGAFGTVYRLDEDTVVKVYHGREDMLPTIEAERLKAQQAFLLGVPTAISYDIVKVGCQYGTVFELVNAKSCGDLVARHPEKLPEIMPQYIHLVKSLHQLSAGPGLLDSVRERYMHYVDAASGVLPASMTVRLQSLISAVPESTNLVHGDLHLKNILYAGGQMVLIDMDQLGLGDPVFEFAGLFASYLAFSEVTPENCMQFHGIGAEVCEGIYHSLLAAYLNEPAEQVLREAEEKAQVAGYIRFLHILTEEHSEDRSALKEKRIQTALRHLEQVLPRISRLSMGS